MKYQVFISSTYEDLKEERDQVVKAVLELGHIPVGMEMFSAGDEQQWKLIARQIEASDYYVVIVADRYGSVDGAVSYTEKEYDYAVSCEVPVLGFILDDAASWPGDRREADPVKQKSLAAFKEKAKKRIVGFWKSKDDLHGKVSIALVKQIALTPRDGWIRSSGAVQPEILNELARLSKANGELTAQLARAVGAGQSAKERDRERVIQVMRAKEIVIHLKYADSKDWEDGPKETLYSIFSELSSELMVETTVQLMAIFIAVIVGDEKRTPLDSWPVPSNHVKSWMADLAALGLVEPSRRKHAADDKHEYWTLSETGKAVCLQMRRSKLEAGIPTGEAPPEGVSGGASAASDGSERPTVGDAEKAKALDKERK